MTTHFVWLHPEIIFEIGEGRKNFIVVEKEKDSIFRVGDTLVFCCRGYRNHAEAVVTCLDDKFHALSRGWIILGLSRSSPEQLIFKDSSPIYHQ